MPIVPEIIHTSYPLIVLKLRLLCQIPCCDLGKLLQLSLLLLLTLLIKYLHVATNVHAMQFYLVLRIILATTGTEASAP